MIIELKGCADGRLIADSAAMGQAVIVAASGEGGVPAVGETFLARAKSRILTYRADERRRHARGWLVTLNRID